jgi:hypothetical protein
MPRSPKQIADFQERLDRFAALQNAGIDIPTIRERMGLSKGHAYNLAAKIRENKNG